VQWLIIHYLHDIYLFILIYMRSTYRQEKSEAIGQEMREGVVGNDDDEGGNRLMALMDDVRADRWCAALVPDVGTPGMMSRILT
jgi:hypothetical protein